MGRNIVRGTSKSPHVVPKVATIKLKSSSRARSLKKLPELFPDERSQHERNYGLTLCRLYTGKEVCEVLRISLRHFHRLCDAGILRWHDVARKKLVQGCEIIRYLQNSLR